MPTSTPASDAPQRAFSTHPRVDRYFAAESIDSARRRVAQCVVRGDGPALVIGAPGVGKTMLLEVLAEELGATARAAVRIVRLASAQLCTRRALLQSILYGMEQPYRDRDEGELRIALQRCLDDEASRGRAVALLIDEAHTLPIRLLEELRILSNMAADGEPTLRLVLAGAASLDETLGEPNLEAFGQRLAARCYLAPMGREETMLYVRAHVAAAGADPDRLFEPAALEAAFTASDGVPRLVNQVCDRSLMLAVDRGVTTIDADLIQAAWSDLHQLPAPWHSPAPKQPKASGHATIEFGELDPPADEPQIGYAEENRHGFAEISQPGFAEEGPIEPIETPAYEAIEAPAAAAWASPPDDRSEYNAAEQGAEAIGRLSQRLAIQRLQEEEAEASAPVEAEPAQEECDEDDNECVSYAFPSRPENDTPAADPDDPFSESFEEEEVVLDRYAGLESTLTSMATPVVNRVDLEFGRMFGALDPAVESLIDAVQSDGAAKTSLQLLSDEEPEDSNVTAEVAESPTVEVAADATDEIAEQDEFFTAADEDDEYSLAPEPFEEQAVEPTDDSDMLVIEEEESVATMAPAGAQRLEYRQLFAELRRG
ncbi:ATPase family associated with various cellular activities (AAA) [Pseudobythopirellula maris]|uniref:ATPase family associated with various cellular activities (AAA) n=1 Tax=Pseudobythopirellula maris TaxID=2527991 RepID=A0A5C5ZNF7_9BACT|nr:AAA family ATPase [Pseudobythopirellula maris]TWT88447.1 ATPase family associated with various cellular activities (AAA) [Pseudobythopirellula maris]